MVVVVPGVRVAVEHVEFVWRNMAIVLTTEYLGVNITNISTPTEIRNIDSFEELFNSEFTIYSDINNNERITVIFKLIKAAIQLSDKFIQKILNEGEINISRKTVEDVESHVNEDEIFAMISKCKMQAYLDTFENIQRLKLRLTEVFPLHKIAMSNQPFDEMYENWELHNVPFSANIILRRSHSLFQSGLIHWWSSWAFRVSSWNVTAGAAINAVFQAVSLQGNIQVLFYLYLGMIGCPIIIFVLEICKLTLARKPANSRSLFQLNSQEEWSYNPQGRKKKINELISVSKFLPLVGAGAATHLIALVVLLVEVDVVTVIGNNTSRLIGGIRNIFANAGQWIMGIPYWIRAVFSRQKVRG
ncbi:unnamed protein product [Orchesella dallaii]|uniref:Uncharacterized protein n=1 Tax=Orchesella dallaii TaxID=48710 RepID=A0ABP1PJC7_9HEXA